MNFTAAVDQLSATARNEMPGLIEKARQIRAVEGDRDQALATLTTRFMRLPHSGIAAIAADALLRLAEESR